MDIEVKKGQVSIFVVVAIFLVASVALFILIENRQIISVNEESFSPEGFVNQCVREKAREIIEESIPRGGFVNTENYKLYKNIRVSYLCKNVNNYETCINQYPLYISSLEKELEENLKPEVNECFISLEEELEDRNYEFSGGDVEMEVELKPGVVEVKTLRNFSFSKNEINRNFDSFTTLISSPFYELAFVVNEIVSQEASYCYFEYVGYNIIYDDILVKKTAVSDSTKIYTLTDKNSGKEMNIAIRGCAIPAGL